MQNWNQWQVPAGPSVTATMPQPPFGYAAPGADPLATMQSYMQYYNQPAPSGYTPEQWAAAQQQNWAQWQTWQQQYQQWQAQYGEKYQETMRQMSTSVLPNLGQLPGTSLSQPPPLPKEDSSAKPPLPPDSNTFGFPGIPPPHQNNLPLFPSNKSNNPPLPLGQPPLPADNLRNPAMNNNPGGKRAANSSVESVSAKKSKVDDEELTEAEKTFDAQFKQWEEQFNKWKQQNANHPDKTQYKQYEAKWTSWREKLIERREQMRRKREQQKQAAAKVEATKDKSLVGDDKILNILSSTENQGLINNLLGIGKTLGLTGKNEGSQRQQTQAPMMQPSTPTAQPAAMRAPPMPPNMNQLSSWASQQWAQYNAGPNMMNYAPGGYPQPSAVQNPLPPAMTLPNFNAPPNFNQPPGNFTPLPANFNQPPGNFNQPPPTMLGGSQNFSSAPPNMSIGAPNFSKPPPGFGPSNLQQTNADQRSVNLQDTNMQSSRPDSEQKQSSTGDGSSKVLGNDRYNFETNRFTGPPPSSFGGPYSGNQFGPNDRRGSDGSNKEFSRKHQMGSGSDDNRRDRSPTGRTSNDIRSDDRFASAFNRDQDDARFNRDSDRKDSLGDNRGRSERDAFNSDRFGSNNDRFDTRNNSFNVDCTPSGDRFGSNNDRVRACNESLGSNNDRFGSNKDRFSSASDRFSSNNDRFTSSSEQTDYDNDRFRSRNDQFGTGDRFGSLADRLGSFGQSNDKFSRPPPDRFESRDNNRDSGGPSFRTPNKNTQFNSQLALPPELQKLMEKRKAAMDVFKPSNFMGFLDSSKKSDTGTSLSESFRKLTGDSPFLSRSSGSFGKDANLGSRSSISSGPGNEPSEYPRDIRSDNSFKPRVDFRTQSGDFRSRGNEFNSRDSGDFGNGDRDFGPRDSRNYGPSGNDFGRQQSEGPTGGPKTLGNFESRAEEFGQRSDKAAEVSKEGEQVEKPCEHFGSTDQEGATSDNSQRILSSPMRLGSANTTDESNALQQNVQQPQSDSLKPNVAALQNVPPLQAPPWMEPDFANDDIVEIPTKQPVGEANHAELSQENQQASLNVDPSRSAVEQSNETLDAQKKPDVLPFMGENDPKPEDLNMEPPPELPNLRPVTTESELGMDSSGSNMNESLDRGNVNRQANFDPSFGKSGMPPKSRDPATLGSTEASDNRPSPFGSRDTDGNVGENTRPPPGTSGSQSSNDGSSFRAGGPHSDSFKSRGPFGSAGPGDFGPRGPSVLGPRGPGDFGPRGPGDFGPRGPGDFGPRGLGNFGPSGPGNFGPSGPGGFGPRGPGDFGPRGPNDFGPKGPGDVGPRGNFGPCGPGDFGPRGPSDFGPRGPSDFGPRGPSDFGPRGPSDFGPYGASNFRPRGPSNFGPGGPPNFGNNPPSDFGIRSPANFGTGGPFEFGSRGTPDFGPRAPLSDPESRGPFDGTPRNPNEKAFCPPGMSPFGPRGMQDKPAGFGSRGNPDTSIPSLMAYKFDRPLNSSDESLAQKGKVQEWGDLPPAFRKDDPEGRAFSGDEPRERGFPAGEDAESSGRGDWRESFGRNQFGDSDQRSGPSKCQEPSAGGSANQTPTNPDRGAGRQENNAFVTDAKMPAGMDRNVNSAGPLPTHPNFGDPSEATRDHQDGSNMTRRSNETRSTENAKDFCAEKQFNYNHSTAKPDDTAMEHLPGNVIDYAHTSRVVTDDYVTPAQCYDYDHGKLKPIVPDHEIYSKRDFRHWIENEQNLREYTDRMKIYESDMRALKASQQSHIDKSSQFRERDRIQDEGRSSGRDRRSFGNYNYRSRNERDEDDYRDRIRRRDSRESVRNERDREWERAHNKQREDRPQHQRSRSRDRPRERPEKIRRETSKENNRDDERSKGSVADSESSAKKPDEPGSPENSNQVSKNDEPEIHQSIMDLAKVSEPPKTAEPPITMELPKTPAFTMVDDLLCPPGRQNRPPKIVVILRGPPGSGKSFVAKLIKDKEVEQGGSAPRILSLDDYFLTEKEVETEENNGKKTTTKEMVYEYEEAMEPSYIASLVKAFKKNITDGFFNFIILDSINEKISDYEDMWSFAKTKGFRVYVCEMEMDVQICLKRNIHNRTEDEINRIVDYFEPTPSYHQKLDVTSMLQEEAIEEVHMEDTEEEPQKSEPTEEDSQDSQEDPQASVGVSKWERMEAEDKLDRLDGLAKRKNEGKPQTMEDFLQVPDYYNMEDTSGKRRVRWADLEERKKQEKMRAVGFVVGQTNWDRMMDPTNGGSALTRTKYI